jgi:hypothetical protein
MMDMIKKEVIAAPPVSKKSKQKGERKMSRRPTLDK